MNTREQILEAAWELYTARGFEDVSVRDVTQAAGVNLASVSYHFGGKDGLVQETLKRCLNPINRYRIELLNREIDNKAGSGQVPLRAVLVALLRPLVMPEECGVPSALVLRVVARYFTDPDYAIPAESRELYTETLGLFVKALGVHFPESSAETLVKSMVFVSGSVICDRGLGGLAMELSGHSSDNQNVDLAEEGKYHEEEREQLLSDVIEFAIHGFGGNTHAPRDASHTTEI